jgi:hypothetical protein
MARDQSMATIAAALAGAPIASGAQDDTDTSVLDPRPAPGIDAPTPLTGISADQKRALDVARQARLDQQKESSDLVTQQEKLLADEQRAQEANQSAFLRGAQGTARAIGHIARGTGVRLESLPTPGSLVLPLSVLLVFFFLLIPVNGHTRFTWLWLVLAGDASIGSSPGGGSGNTVSPTSAPGGLPISSPAVSAASAAAGGVASTPTSIGTAVQSAINSAAAGILAGFSGNETPE